MARYLFINDWSPGMFYDADTKPIGFDNSPGEMVLDIGSLSDDDARTQWMDLAKVQYPDRLDTYTKDMRERLYNRNGATREALALTLWEAQLEGKSDALEALQEKREAIKVQYPKTKTLTESIDDAVIEVNRLIGFVRTKYITNIPGQEITYQQKALEAQRYELDPTPDGINYPYLQTEATSTGQTLNDIYLLIKGTAAAWNQLGATIEGLRRGTIVAIEKAVDVVTIDAIMVNFKNQLKSF